MPPCSGRCWSTSRTTAERSRRLPGCSARRGCSPSRYPRIRSSMDRATSGPATSVGTRGRSCSRPAREPASPSTAASAGGSRFPGSTIATSMSDTSTGEARPGRSVGTGRSSPSSAPSSSSTGSSSASSAARSATSPWRLARRPVAVVWAGMAVYAGGFGLLAALEHRAFETGRFDLGNMVQAVWSTAHGRPLDVTELDGDQINRLAAHVDPLLAAFAPLWWLWPSPTMLLVAQAVAVSLGALPVFWLARKHLGSQRLAVLFSLAYLLYAPVQWLALDEFHAVALACPLLLYAVWYLDEGRLFAALPFLALAALTKEEVPLVMAGLGVWFAIARGRRVAGTAIGVAGTALSVFFLTVVMPYFRDGDSPAFYDRYD